jgi:FKBP-type peptidyl-prolyl cis-trans isomerase
MVKLVLKDMGLPALKEAALLMKEGTRLRIEAPPSLAFGDKAQTDLPANSVTVWELELLSIKALKMPVFERSAPGKAVKTASGLEIETIHEGTGERSPKQGDAVTVNYAGWLTNGTLFDSSYARGDPAQFRVGMVIEGWNEALKGMKEGSIVRLTIPPSLAYGAMGQGKQIPPNATLIFYVELIKIGS